MGIMSLRRVGEPQHMVPDEVALPSYVTEFPLIVVVGRDMTGSCSRMNKGSRSGPCTFCRVAKSKANALSIAASIWQSSNHSACEVIPSNCLLGLRIGSACFRIQHSRKKRGDKRSSRLYGAVIVLEWR